MQGGREETWSHRPPFCEDQVLIPARLIVVLVASYKPFLCVAQVLVLDGFIAALAASHQHPFCAVQVLVLDRLIVALVVNNSYQRQCQGLLSHVLHSGIDFCTDAKNLYYMNGTNERINHRLEVGQCVCSGHSGNYLHCN